MKQINSNVFTKSQECNVIHGVCEVLMNNNLADPDLFPVIRCTNNESPEHMRYESPVWLFSFISVVEAKHDGEGTGWQQLLLVVVVFVIIVVVVVVKEAVGRC